MLLGGYTLWNFLGALAWAGIFAIALWPLYHMAVARFGTGRHNVLLPMLFTLAVALVFIVPLGLVGMQLAREFHGANEWVRDVGEHGLPEPDAVRHLPFGQAQVDGWWQENLTDPGSAKELVQRTTRGRVVDFGRLVGAQVFRRLTLFAFTLLTLFFLFKEGETPDASRCCRAACPSVRTVGGERIGRQMIASVHGTVDGLVLVGLGGRLHHGHRLYRSPVCRMRPCSALFTAIAAMVPFGSGGGVRDRGADAC